MKLLVADDHTLVRQGMLAVLRDSHPDWTVDEAGSLDQVLESLSRNPVDLVILDLGMPGMDRSTSLQALREAYRETRVAILTAIEDREVILACLAAGVHGYILKSDGVGQLVYAIESIIQGHVYVPAALSRVNQAVGLAEPAAAVPSKRAYLTPRQIVVLKLLAEGRSTKDIARQLNLGVGTIKVHLAGVYRALGAQTRMEAIVKAGQFNLCGTLDR